MQAEEQDADLMMSRTAARWQVEVARTQRLQDELNRMRDAAESATSPSHVREIMELDAMASQLSSELEQRRRRRQISYLIDDSNSDALVAELMRDRVVTSRTVVEGAPRMRTGEASKLAQSSMITSQQPQNVRHICFLLSSLRASVYGRKSMLCSELILRSRIYR